MATLFTTKKRQLGRPPKFRSVAQLKKAIEEYFASVPDEELTISGLALELGMTRHSLMNYAKRKDFAQVIADAKGRIELSYERALRRNGRGGEIFALKNFGWIDRQEIDHTSKGEKLAQNVFVVPHFEFEPDGNGNGKYDGNGKYEIGEG